MKDLDAVMSERFANLLRAMVVVSRALDGDARFESRQVTKTKVRGKSASFDVEIAGRVLVVSVREMIVLGVEWARREKSKARRRKS